MFQLQASPPALPPTTIRLEVGDVSVIVDRSESAIGAALGQSAAVPHDWLGIGRVDAGPLLVVVARNRADFAEWSRGRLPSWGGGAAFPANHLVVIRLDAGDPFQTLRHELAHVALHQYVAGRVPLWFDEGYAVLASGEYNRLADLRLNLAVATGSLPTDLGALDALLRGDATDAEEAYALAGSAVAELANRNPSSRLDPLLTRLHGGTAFDDAVLATTGLSPDRFDELWHQSVRRHYNLLIWLATGGAWLLVTILLMWAAAARRRRDRPRRAALDIGWPQPPPDDPDVTIQDVPTPQLDRSGPRR